MERWANKVAFVTGASSGIGEGVAKALTLKGVKVVGLARRKEKLEQLEKQWEGHESRFYPIQSDIRNEDEVLRAFAWVKENLGGVDILMNNAGFAVQKRIVDSITEDFRKILETNILAASICAREAIESMKERKSPGHIVNINSLMGHTATISPIDFSIYAPNKFALTALSQLLQKEASDEKLDIKVTNLSPDLVKTEFDVVIPGVNNVYDVVPYVETKDIADAVLFVLSTPSHILISELTINASKFPSSAQSPASN